MAVFHYCEDCETSSAIHIQEWLDVLLGSIIPKKPLPYWLENAFNKAFIKVLTVLQIATLCAEYDLDELSPRVRFFIEAAGKRGICCSVLKIGDRYTEHLILEYKGKRYYFEAYPTGSHFDGIAATYTSNKSLTKRHLLSGGFPTPPGKSYYFWQKDKAVRESIRDIGFPLVVKPAHGTFSRHVTINIRGTEGLKQAIRDATAYQPSFIVERYVENAFVHRVTVINFMVVAIAKQMAPSVIGNGVDTIAMLMERKNALRGKGHPLLKQIKIGEGMEIDTGRVPEHGEIVTLNDSPFMRYGADIVDITEHAHSSLIELGERIARHFDIRCAGIDVLLEDASRPIAGQTCAILEVNNLPSIEMHASENGREYDVAEALTSLFLKYYAGI